MTSNATTIFSNHSENSIKQTATHDKLIQAAINQFCPKHSQLQPSALNTEQPILSKQAN